MIIDTTEVQAINSFSRWESLKEVYGIIWMLIPILTLVLGFFRITAIFADETAQARRKRSRIYKSLTNNRKS